MVYEFKGWKLYEIEPNFKYIGKRKMYFFIIITPRRGIPCELPVGYEVILNRKTGLPFLKYKNKTSLYQKNKNK
jgi:hypothetical protein